MEFEAWGIEGRQGSGFSFSIWFWVLDFRFLVFSLQVSGSPGLRAVSCRFWVFDLQFLGFGVWVMGFSDHQQEPRAFFTAPRAFQTLILSNIVQASRVKLGSMVTVNGRRSRNHDQ
jgi:hypothetical protein